jgi:toxin CptA
MLVPGSNDGLIMIGLPLLQPHAWIAVLTMVLTIAAPIALARHFRRPALA